MAAATLFEEFVGHLGLGYHGNLNTNTLKVALFQAAAAPAASDTAVYATYSANEVANGNGYTTGGEDSTNTYSEAGGTGTLGGTDIVWTATGAVNNIRYAILFNDNTTTVTDGLIEFWDYGSEIDLATSETFTFDIQTSLLTIS